MKPDSSIARQARRMIRNFGIDIHRYPLGDGLGRAIQLLRNKNFDLVVDVGASDGGYARDLWDRGYKGRLVSYEPLTAPFLGLERASKRKREWIAIHAAVGEFDGRTVVNIAGNNGESSSILKMLPEHVISAPSSAYVAEEECQIVRLDTSLPELMGADLTPFFLKIDVQGRERQVLEGCGHLFDLNLVIGIQVEVSIVPLYEGSTTWEEINKFARDNSLDLFFIRPGFTNSHFRLLQFDAFFFRNDLLG